MRTARAKGLNERDRSSPATPLRNALIPTITVLGLTFAGLLAGAVLTETIFSWPGIGRYGVQAALKLDYPSLLGVTLFVAFAYVLVNFLVDVVYGVLDPQDSALMRMSRLPSLPSREGAPHLDARAPRAAQASLDRSAASPAYPRAERPLRPGRCSAIVSHLARARASRARLADARPRGTELCSIGSSRRARPTRSAPTSSAATSSAASSGAPRVSPGRHRRDLADRASSAALLGALAGYLGGAVDSVIMRTADAILSFPSIILAMAITAVRGGPGLATPSSPSGSSSGRSTPG